MNVSALFIRRPVATSLLVLALFALGCLAAFRLPVSTLPNVEYPSLQVSTVYPGASPERMSALVTVPLERNLGQLPGLESMYAISGLGVSTIYLRFGLDVNLAQAEQDVAAAINILSILPPDLPDPPVYRRVNPTDAPILTVAFTSPKMSLVTLSDLLDTRLVPAFSQVLGVGQVSVQGLAKPAVRIQVEPAVLSAVGLTAADIEQAVQTANVSQAKGSLEVGSSSLIIQANDQLPDIKAFESLVLVNRLGHSVFLGDVATVIQATENKELAATANGKTALIVQVKKQPGANVIATVNRLYSVLEKIQSTLPPGVQSQILVDQSVGVKSGIEAVVFELFLATVLVVVIIWLFLGSFKLTLIPMVAVPLSLVGTFAIMYLFGFSINYLTLMALTIATGFVVDDAIVVTENIARYIEQGLNPIQASLKGAGEIGFTIISLTFSLIAGLIPLLFMQDIAGRLFHEFAVSLAVCILISALVSLSLTPMMCAHLFKKHQIQQKNKKQAVDFQKNGLVVKHAQQNRFKNYLKHIVRLYRAMLLRVLRKPKLTYTLFILTTLFTLLVFLYHPKGFIPLQNSGLVQIKTKVPANVSLAEHALRQEQWVDNILSTPWVAQVSTQLGAVVGNEAHNEGRILLNLSPKGQALSLNQLNQKLSDFSTTVAGMDVEFQAVQALGLNDRPMVLPYSVVLKANTPNAQVDLVQGLSWVLDRISQHEAFAQVTSSWNPTGLQWFIEIDRSEAARLQVSIADINASLYNAFGQRQIATLYTQTQQVRVILEMQSAPLKVAEILDQIKIKSRTGHLVPLLALAQFAPQQTPVTVERSGKILATTIGFALNSGYSLEMALDSLTQLQQDENWPQALDLQFQASTDAFLKTKLGVVYLLLAAVVAMYIILGILYESFIHPITILSTLPSAGLGALFLLWVMHYELDLVAVIGIILLIGIVKKNAIMMIDFAVSAQREQGLPARQAIFKAAVLRFRPILMTTMAAFMGAVPLMFAQGMGSELRQPLGVAMIGGLCLSQVLTLFSTPVIYLLFSRWTNRINIQPLSESASNIVQAENSAFHDLN